MNAIKSLHAKIESIHIKGFRSLADFKVEDLPNATVMIGANGAGKSNVFRFLEMVGSMLTPPSGELAKFVRGQGGADDLLFGGRGRTRRIEADLGLRTTAGWVNYRFALAPASPDRLEFADERFRLRRDDRPSGSPSQETWQDLGFGHPEAKLLNMGSNEADSEAEAQESAASALVNTLGGCSCHHFHDTSDRSPIRKTWDASDWRRLRDDGGNLASVLHFLERNDNHRYESICYHIGRVLPTFDRFIIEERRNHVQLRWKAKGSDKAHGTHLASDGSLRTFALMTLLNLPLDLLPSVVLLDEPELGLHPAALSLVGGMVSSLAARRQIIVATQSSLLVDEFDLDQLLVFDLDGDATTVQRPRSQDYREWLGECSTGEMWEKNLLRGYP